MFDDIQLSRSFCYLAAGLDLQPLMRFSHVTQSFIFVDWNLEEDTVIASFEEQANDALRLRGGGRAVAKADIGSDTPFPVGFVFTDDEYARMNTAAERVCGPGNPWAREFTFERRVGGESRELKLLYVCGEAFFTYSAVYVARKLAPLIACTIQSGPGFGCGWSPLEQPGERFEQFLLACEVAPRFWLRGQRAAPFLEGASAWSDPLQRYTGWSAVELFGRPTEPLELQDMTELGDGVRSVVLRRGLFTADDLDDFDIAFLTERAAVRLELADHENVTTFAPDTMSLESALGQVGDVCGEASYQRAVMLPVGLEDESVVLHDWTRGDGPPTHLEIRFEYPFDFVDLRGWPDQ